MALRKLWSHCLLAAAGMSLAATGCVTEYGKPEPSLWTSIDTEKEQSLSALKLKHPGRMHLIAAKVAETRKLHADARQHYQAALKEEPRNVEAILGIARLDQHAGRMRDASRGFDRAMQLAPNDDEVLGSIGMFHASQGRWQQATGMLHRAVSANPNNKDHRFHLGVVLAKAGNYPAAEQQFTVAVGKPMAHYHIGYLLYEQGRNEEAARRFQLALTLQPDLEAPKEMLTKLGYHRPREQYADAGRRPIQSVGHTAPPNNQPMLPQPRHEPIQRVQRTQPVNNGNGPLIVPGPLNRSIRTVPQQQPRTQPAGRQSAQQRIVIPPPYQGNVR